MSELGDFEAGFFANPDLGQVVSDFHTGTSPPSALVSGPADRRFQPSWPNPPEPAAFHGPAGQYVRVIEPHTEADLVAILTATLTAFGNLVGRGPHFWVESDRHGANVDMVAVGNTSKARKGIAQGRSQALIQRCDRNWTANNILSGLSSGEGLIWAVRDPIKKYEPASKGREAREVITDPGVKDKRLLVIESEFVSVLKQAERQGNTLSAVLRQCWETGKLRILNKNSPAVATGAHISIIGHITGYELRRFLGATEQANGFANRFIWICTRRSKFLPDDEDRRVSEEVLAPIIQQFRASAEFARNVGEVRRNEDARDYWRAVYPRLSEGKPGLLGAITSRAEAQVLRLSMIYALLDCSAQVRGEHLEAALALWEYSERSCRFIFGDATGNPDADAILAALRNAPAGLSRTEISGILGRNRPAAVIARALDELAAMGLVRCERRETEGRSCEIWSAV
jgi:hypothetical protein